MAMRRYDVRQFNVEAFLTDKHIDYRESGASRNAALRCPLCTSPGDKLYVNLDTCHFICFRGHTKGRTAGAFVALFEQPFAIGATLRKYAQFFRVIRSKEAERVEEPKFPGTLPSSPIGLPIQRQLHRFLRNRHISRAVANHYRIAVALDPPYKHYAILPVSKRFFVARNISSQKNAPRYLTAPRNSGYNGKQDGVVFVTNRRRGRKKVAVVVEGVFDALAVERASSTFFGIAIFGKSLADAQLIPILQAALPCSKFVIMLDADAKREALQLANIFQARREVCITVPPPPHDPSSLEPSQLRSLIHGAKKYTFREHVTLAIGRN